MLGLTRMLLSSFKITPRNRRREFYMDPNYKTTHLAKYVI